MSFDDPDYKLVSWEYSLNDGAFVPGEALSHSPGTPVNATLTLPEGNTSVRYRVRVHNDQDETREQEGSRSVCTSEWPKVDIDDSGMECGSGSGTVVLRGKTESDGSPQIQDISYIVGVRATQTDATENGEIRLDYGPAAAYRLRTGGEVIRAAARDTTGSIGEVMVKGICPGFVDSGDLPAPTEPQQTGTEGGKPPQPGGSDVCRPTADRKEDSAGLDAQVNLGNIPVRATAQCVFRWRGTQQWVLTDGAVRIAGVDFTKDDDTPYAGREYPGITHAIVIRKLPGQEPELFTLGKYAIKLGNMTLLETDGLRMKGRKFRTELNAVAGKLRGLNPARNVSGSLDFSRDSATLDLVFAADQLGTKFSDVSLRFGATVDYENGLQLGSVHAGVDGQIKGLIELRGDLLLRKRDGHDVFGGDVKATFGAAARKLSGISAGLSFSIADGKLERATGTVAKALVPPRPLGTPLVLLTKLGLDLGYEKQSANSTLSFGGRAGFVAGGFKAGDFGTLALADGELALIYAFNENSADAIRLEGNAKLLHGNINGSDAYGGELAGETTLRFSGFLDMQGKFSLKPSFLKDSLFEGSAWRERSSAGWTRPATRRSSA